MKLFVNGINHSTGVPLFPPLDEQDFAAGVVAALSRNAAELRILSRSTATGTTFRGEIERERMVDLGDPRAAGWTFLLNGNDPQREAIIEALRPLAEHRGMANQDEPLIFADESPDQWYDWLLENYSSLVLDKVPHFVLIVGGPDCVPFRFQSILGTAAAVGRVGFDSVEDLRTYVEKIIRLETAADPAVLGQAICFAPDAGPDDATYFSRRYMGEPLAEHIRDRYGMETLALMGDKASKTRLQEALHGTKPALVYTASHGIAAPEEPFEFQKQINGAICCQHEPGTPLDAWLFSAGDVPLDEPFLEGAVLFQFACFGYGTPRESDFWHWGLGKTKLNTHADFIAALPKRLLAHPNGPVAYIGHVDLACLHGFVDPAKPHTLDRWQPRMEPFVSAVERLLKAQPVGLAMANMCKKYDICNALLTGTYEQIQRGKIQQTPDFHSRLSDAFITRTDAQNYFILGDPAVSLRIADGS
ncbi:hypothetical protein [Mesorhizobium sp.]|uniref:hypothetical protein n=1 Tax=Mesorhizobium sp. TaxID=1871066 RepID=UPI001227FFA2|nr:hypothetical protein [Mesorhizobium sp.]TIL42219.1 MAG: hypothetical protein E5Y86_28475 [Mesorhizobium sp.]